MPNCSVALLSAKIPFIRFLHVAWIGRNATLYEVDERRPLVLHISKRDYFKKQNETKNFHTMYMYWRNLLCIFTIVLKGTF